MITQFHDFDCQFTYYCRRCGEACGQGFGRISDPTPTKTCADCLREDRIVARILAALNEIGVRNIISEVTAPLTVTLTAD